MPSQRSQKEINESKLTKQIIDSFDKEFYHDFRLTRNDVPVVFAVSDELKKEKSKYISISYSNRLNKLKIKINPVLLDEKPKVIKQQGQRAALKLFLIYKGLSYGETSNDYLRLSKRFGIWNYGNYSEVPTKYHLYTCSVCHRAMLVYSKPLPKDHPILIEMKTLWHKKNDNSETEQAHQGRYSYAGHVELKNWELQHVLYVMDQISKHDGGKDTDPIISYDDEYLDEHPELGGY